MIPISPSALNRALMNPMPTLALARKWVSSTVSTDSTPGPHWPTWVGSVTNDQTLSRGAAISTEPSKCMDPPGWDRQPPVPMPVPT